MRLFIFGVGYSCEYFLRFHAGDVERIGGTVRSDARRRALASLNADLHIFDEDHADPLIAERLAEADRIIVSVPPGADGDPVLSRFGQQLAAGTARVIYLSTVGVYADHAGGWIDEAATAVADEGRRGLRTRAEAAWQAACPDRVSILRLAGIYGPGRNALRNLRDGRAHRIVKPGQVFNRIHVDDIARAINAAVAADKGGIWNICDDEPAPPQDVVTYAAQLMGMAPPPEQDFDTADLSPMARSFYATSNRISNARLRQELGIDLAFPDYRSGLKALWNAGEGR
ncbi:NAD(P)-dependent oxidoreductase [Tardiphaga alba]|uniref:NAD(P)-dependent oxidoreductase n=1 Tax=Tardiphaga alba TaxID=340268 RepID=A0ABX8A664_9BRAD|nr:NAD(P)-dependent oxidoreductase [Tardiphaga alba]QUS38531.1 NAD(P)-dependent oxidoreductase [Tardiphaga alba]